MQMWGLVSSILTHPESLIYLIYPRHVYAFHHQPALCYLGPVCSEVLLRLMEVLKCFSNDSYLHVESGSHILYPERTKTEM